VVGGGGGGGGGGVLLPLLWIYIRCYLDDICLLAVGKFPNTV